MRKSEDKVNARKLVSLISKRVAVKPKFISDIQVMDKFSFVTVPFDIAEQIVVSFKKKGQKPLITRVKEKKRR